MDGGTRRLGILAGGGDLPREIADSATERGIDVSIVAIDGEADGDFGPHPVTVVNWGQIGAMVKALKAQRATELIIVGHVHRPELGGLKPDLGFFRYLPKLIRIVASGGDDSVLRRVVRFFEQQGLRVVGPAEAAPELVVREGAMGAVCSTPGHQADIAKGLAVIRALGTYDIGQGVIVRDGRLLAIEGVEGTDRMIARVKGEGAAHGGGVLVKRSKPGQDLRVDMPAIGPATVDGVRAAGLAGIAVQAGGVLVAGRARTIARADSLGMFVEGVRDAEGSLVARRFDSHLAARSAAKDLQPLGRVSPRSHAILDTVKALAAIDALAPVVQDAGQAAVVVRNHVLAVEAGGEGVAATVERAAGLRQWASLTHRRRGVVGLRTLADLTPDVVETAAKAGYAGIAAAGGPAGSETFMSAIAAADRQGLFVLMRRRRGEGVL